MTNGTYSGRRALARDDNRQEGLQNTLTSQLNERSLKRPMRAQEHSCDENVKADANWEDSKCLRVDQGASGSAQCENHVPPAGRCTDWLLRHNDGLCAGLTEMRTAPR